ncbi:unnamed protein product [Prorocentrum cordatum]|uniref:Uncharacterized protein n=1 Tax=Prorocentrum cordatum TaxID=2364126 RepID=A0ABN9QW34_9DINO|nr:unnamed protein product [Polarella glacialis]
MGCDGGRVGDVVELARAATVTNDSIMGLALLSNVSRGFVERLREGEARGECLSRTAGRRGDSENGLDSRALPVARNTSRVRQRFWRETVANMSQVAFSEWLLPCPRTVDWRTSFAAPLAGDISARRSRSSTARRGAGPAPAGIGGQGCRVSG